MSSTLVIVALCLLAVVSGQQFQQQQRYAQILKLDNNVSPDGQFQYGYQTEDGISSEARGTLVNSNSRDADGPATAVTGQYSYTGPDGQVYTVSYVADENGYRASGAHLPVAPEIPDAIKKSLQVIASSPQSGFQQAAAVPATTFQRTQTFSSFQQPQQAFSGFQGFQGFQGPRRF